MKWAVDPITKTPSVALTLLMLATGLMVIAVVMEAFTNMRSTHLLDELFGAAISLYGGHMFAFRGSPNVPDTVSVRTTVTEQPPSVDISPR